MTNKLSSAKSQLGKSKYSVQVVKELRSISQHPRFMLFELSTLLFFLYLNITIGGEPLELIRRGIAMGFLIFVIYLVLIWLLRKDQHKRKAFSTLFQLITSLVTFLLLTAYGGLTFSEILTPESSVYDIIQSGTIIPAWFLIYFLVTDKKITLADQEDSSRLLQKLVQEKQAVAIYPTKSKERIDYQSVNKLPKRVLNAKQEDEKALNDYIPLQQIPFLIIQQGAGRANKRIDYTVPSSFSISQIKGAVKQHEINHLESKLVSLSNLFLMNLFSNFKDQSLIWPRINPNYLLYHPSSSDLPFKGGIIVHRWSIQELQNVADKIITTERNGLISEHNNPIFSSYNYAKKMLIYNPIEMKRIQILLTLLRLRIPVEKEHFWISMLNGFCIGNETKLSGDFLRKDNLIFREINPSVAEKLTKDSKSHEVSEFTVDAIVNKCGIEFAEAEILHKEIEVIRSEMIRINDTDVLRESEIERVMDKPVEEFIKVHDHMNGLLKETSQNKFLPPKEVNTYIDSMVKQMLLALNATKYVERQVSSGLIGSGKLVAEREGIIAGFTLSAKTTLEALSLAK